MPPDLWDTIATGGPWALLLAAAIWAGYKRFWTWGWAADERVKATEQRCAEQITLLTARLTDLQTRVQEVRADHAAELAQVRADKDAQIRRESERVDAAWDYLDQTLTAQQQIARSAAVLVNGSAGSGASPVPPGPPPAPPPSTRRPRS